MEITYDNAKDVLCVRFSDVPVAKNVPYGRNVSVGYDADGQLVEITLLDLSSVLTTPLKEDEATLALTERESRRVLELLESPPPRSAHFLAAMARYREWRCDNESAVGADVCAWMAHQANLLRSGALNEVQRDVLARFFETQVATKHQDCEALLRRALVDRWRQDHLRPDHSVAQRLDQFRARVREVLRLSPSLRDAARGRLEAIWREARLDLGHSPAIGEHGVPERPETCPYTLDDLVQANAEPTAEGEADSGTLGGVESSTCSTHITPVAGNIFLDLGFPPGEAERLKEESDRRISGKKGNADSA